MKRLDLIVAVLLSAANGSAQTALFDWTGAAAGDNFGTETCSPGDLNGDGIGDFVFKESAGVGVFALKARSGFDGSPLWTSPAYQVVSDLQRTGDVNGDGVGDIVARAGNPPPSLIIFPAVMFSGLDGSVIWTANTFTAPSGQIILLDMRPKGAGYDYNGDGVPDILIEGSTTAVIGTHYAVVISGTNGASIGGVQVASSGFGIAYRAFYLPDISGDGLAEFALSYVVGSTVSFYGAPGATLRLTKSQPNPSGIQLRFGLFVGTPGDVDFDGIAEFAISRHPTTTSGGPPPPPPETAFYFGGSYASLGLIGFGTIGAGGDIEPLGDVDGDGAPDMALFIPPIHPVLPPLSPTGATIYSGGTGAVINAFTPPTVAEPVLILAGPDVNADGRAEYLLIDPLSDLAGVDAGRVRTFSATAVPAATSAAIGPTCPTSLGGLFTAAAPIMGSNAVLSLANAVPNVSGNLAIDLAPPVSTPLDPAIGCDFRLDVSHISQWILVPIATDGAGAFSFGFPVPAVPILAGLPITMQVVLFVTANGYGFATSNGVVASLGY